MGRRRNTEGEAPAPKRERAKWPSKNEQLAALRAKGWTEAEAYAFLGISTRRLSVTVKVRLPRDVYAALDVDGGETVAEALVRLATAEAGERATAERAERDVA